jgi:hypothetical protein
MQRSTDFASRQGRIGGASLFQCGIGCDLHHGIELRIHRLDALQTCCDQFD